MNRKIHSKNPKGFTLIELLVVVAIISILVGISVVNYQNAHARSKVARVQADIRTLCCALEVYRFDSNAYPLAAIQDFQLDKPLVSLTSPISYLTALPQDPFGLAAFNFNSEIKIAGYNYKDRATTSIGMPADTYGPIWLAFPGKHYFIHSPGPNRIWDVLPYMEYDPTNGTISQGDICYLGPL